MGSSFAGPRVGRGCNVEKSIVSSARRRCLGDLGRQGFGEVRRLTDFVGG